MKTLAKATLKVVNRLPDSPRPSLTYLKKHWDRLGGELAADSIPHKVVYRNGIGRLTLACSGGRALSLQHLKPQLLVRLNRNLEADAIGEIDFIQRPL